MNWLALIQLVVKYGPAVAAFVKQEEPNIQAFIKDVEAAFAGTGTAPNLGTIFQQFLAALQTGTPPAAAAGTALAKSNPAMMPTSGPGGTFTS